MYIFRIARLLPPTEACSMMHRRTPFVFLLTAALLACCCVPARGHEFKLDAIINAFVTMEPGEAHLVVRVPVYLFKSAKFPNNGTEIEIAQSGPALERALAAFQQDVVLFEDGRRLTASKASGRLSLPSDKSFDSYNNALRHVAEPHEQVPSEQQSEMRGDRQRPASGLCVHESHLSRFARTKSSSARSACSR